jgi:hypothetical protein
MGLADDVLFISEKAVWNIEKKNNFQSRVKYIHKPSPSAWQVEETERLLQKRSTS